MAVISFVMFGLIFPKDHRIIYLVRTKAVHGDGESAREIHPKSRTAHTATLRASYQEKHVPLGAQNQAFSQVKAELAQPTTLTLYDVRAATKISEDVSSYRLGAVLLQKSTPPGNQSHMLLGQWQRLNAEYTQREKEALAITWACEKFADYILGKKFTIETDHKPLVLLLRISTMYQENFSTLSSVPVNNDTRLRDEAEW